MVKKAKKLTVSAGSCQAIRQKLPDALKEKFGSLGFVKWTCAYSPVLIVDPMQMVLAKEIPEGIYHAWIYQLYLNSSYGNRLDGDDEENENDEGDEETPLELLPVLIFWFGTQYEFSIVRFSHVMDWKEGCRKGYNKLPPFMDTRIQTLHRPVPAVYALLDDALKRVDVKLRPEERSLAVVTCHSKKKKQPVVLNEWHALAMGIPPQIHAWEENKAMLMPELPLSELFGQIAFLPRKCGQHNYHHPVLVLNPFRVPPQMRTEWFHKCSSGQYIMVYWMGAYTSGRMQQGVYTCHKPSDLIPYEEGEQKGYDKVPRDIMRDYNQLNLPAKRLYGIDWWVCGTMWELPQALEREPKDRWGGLEDFEEDHDDDFDYYRECLSSAKEADKAKEQHKQQKGGKKERKKQPKIPRPTKEVFLDDLEEDDDDETSDEDASIPAEEEEEDDDDESTSTEDFPVEPVRISPRLNGAKSASPAASEEKGLFDDSSEEPSPSPRRKRLRVSPTPTKAARKRSSPRTPKSPKQPSPSIFADASFDETKDAVDSLFSSRGLAKKNEELDDQKRPGKINLSPRSKVMAKDSNTSLSNRRHHALSAFESQGSLKIPLREEDAERTEQSTEIDTASSSGAQNPSSVTASVAVEEIPSDELLHDAVEHSLLGCAAYLQEESQKTTGKRQKRKVSQMLLSPPTNRKSTTTTKAPDRILQLKKRKEETHQKALGVMEQLKKEEGDGN